MSSHIDALPVVDMMVIDMDSAIDAINVVKSKVCFLYDSCCRIILMSDFLL